MKNFIIVLCLALFASCAFARDLKEGASGNDVKQWQQFLNTRNFDLPANGKFGPATKRATTIFQKKWDLYADGVVGLRTLEKAKSLGYGSSANQTSSGKDPAIFAGEGIGKVKLSEKRENVIRKLGKPTQSFFWETLPIRQDVYIGKKSNSRLVVLYGRLKSGEIVAQIESTSPTFLTPEGLSLKSSLRELRDYIGRDADVAFLRPIQAQKRERYVVNYNNRKGIAFWRGGLSDRLFYDKVMVFQPSNTRQLPLINPAVYMMQ